MAQPVRLKRGELPATREDIRAAYRVVLGREPESEAVLDSQLVGHPTRNEIRNRFLQSEEFSAANPGLLKNASLPLVHEGMAVEVEARPEALAAMLQRTGGYWSQVGQEAPHWSVLTNDRYRPERIEETREAFYATGQGDLDLVRNLLERHGIDPARLPLCLEYGCGVGRATLALAGLFQRVIGCDISAPHLELARQEAARRGISNLGWHHSGIAAPMPAGGWNLWYSRIVLQHNPPPIMAHLLRLAFAGLAPGGVAIFQVPTHSNGYGFAIDRYMAASDSPHMEMHVLPQRHVFALAAEAGLEVLEVREDTQAVTDNHADWLSNMFVLRRPEAGLGGGAGRGVGSATKRAWWNW